MYVFRRLSHFSRFAAHFNLYFAGISAVQILLRDVHDQLIDMNFNQILFLFNQSLANHKIY